MMQMTFDRCYGSFMSSMLHLLGERQTLTPPSPISFADYTAKCPVAERFRSASEIATIVNFYDSSTITTWAVAELLAHLSTCCTTKLLPRLHLLATACRDLSPQFYAAVRQQWCKLIRTTTDPVATLCAAKDINDTYLQAYAYFHVLQKTNGDISQYTRLTPLDRMRLLVGSMNLRRYDDADCRCADRGTYHYNDAWGTAVRKHKEPRPQTTTDAYLWSTRTTAPLQDSYEKHSLWDMFTVSPVGLVLHDGVALSQPPVPQSSIV